MLDVPALDRLLDAADAALAAGTGAPLVVIAPADARDGTNALLLCPPGIIEPHFGPGSLEAHLRAARDAGATVQLVVDPVVGFRPRHTGRPRAPGAGPAGRARGPWRGRGDPRLSASVPAVHRLLAVALPELPEIRQGDDLAALIAAAWRELAAAEPDLAPRAGDVLVVTQKIVSKAEGAVVDLRTVTPRPEAVEFGERWDRDPRQVEVVLREATDVVRMERGVLITRTRHGFVCANAGVDASNVAPDTVTLLPARSRTHPPATCAPA